MNPDRYQDDAQTLAAYKAGQIDAKLEQLTKHAESVNGSIADSAEALAALVSVVVEVKTKVKVAAYLLGAVFTALVGSSATAIAYVLIHHPH